MLRSGGSCRFTLPFVSLRLPSRAVMGLQSSDGLVEHFRTGSFVVQLKTGGSTVR